ncbi:nucleoside 2-deoxyribosyltransferase [Companilactobacillus furfuricola]|uniref:nucleoside 2-deoxyribosyltransferase n=1 Tax=Companilactobacillus furfuricola TaxID=1462575 RepID=UPI000F779E74|nr:nucleoside 2-deoxyribosyltransferase [Companilactobacillus furfuricola]
MKIYFSGSIRGGRDRVDVYRAVIDFLKLDHVVLTEHVGDVDFLDSESGMDDASIRDRDVAWIREADLVVADCSIPSLGVGYELACAECFDKPVILLHDPDVSDLSAMISGDGYFSDVNYYHNADEAVAILRQKLAAL